MKTSLARTMWYQLFVDMADSNKAQKVQRFISLAKIPRHERNYIIRKLNSLSRSRFFITHDLCLAANCYLYQGWVINPLRKDLVKESVLNKIASRALCFIVKRF